MSRRSVAGSIAAGIVLAVVVVLMVPSTTGGWTVTGHWTCVSTKVDEVQPLVIPVTLVNSPWNGSALGGGSIPPSYPGAIWSQSSPWIGTHAENGTPLGNFAFETMFVNSSSSTFVWGPGTDSPCTGPLALGFSGFGGFAAGMSIGPRSPSDAGEPTQWGLPHAGYTPFYNNSFYEPNSPPISTCGRSAETTTATSAGLQARLNYTAGGQNYSTLQFLPIQTQYEYGFPANTGTWEVDNLSLPGGPGGGWAFSFTPCP